MQNRLRDCPASMQTAVSVRQSSFLRRCVELVYTRETHDLVKMLAGWNQQSSIKSRRHRTCSTLLQSGRFLLMRRMFGIFFFHFYKEVSHTHHLQRLESFVADNRKRRFKGDFLFHFYKEVSHTHHLQRLERIVAANRERRLKHGLIMAWHFSADIHETRKIRRLATSKLLSSSLQKQRRTRVFLNWVSYTHYKKHLRASESHVVFKRQLFLKRRFFREWKDVEWLKYFSGILEKWYRMSMGQVKILKVGSLLSLLCKNDHVADF